ncbi:MAG: hypothetical protein B7Z55_19765, partial [Planctomycetales bacterium 12-60-4]
MVSAVIEGLTESPMQVSDKTEIAALSASYRQRLMHDFPHTNRSSFPPQYGRTSLNSPAIPHSAATAELPDAIAFQLRPTELLVAYVRSDVDNRQQFSATFVVLTTERLISIPSGNRSEVASWQLAEVVSLSTQDRAGLGTLDALGDDRRLAFWHYTLRHGPEVVVLMERFERMKGGNDPFVVAEDEHDVPEAESQPPPPSTFALFRMWEFAQPHQGWIVLAFLISMLATVASIIPIKLTGPLIDSVLNPYEFAWQQAGPDGELPPQALTDLLVVRWYLLGMFGA